MTETDDSLLDGAADCVKRLRVLCELLDEVDGCGWTILCRSVLLQARLVREYARELQGGGLQSEWEVSSAVGLTASDRHGLALSAVSSSPFVCAWLIPHACV